MKNCVFIPIFDAVKLDSFFLLLESIGIYSNIKNDTEVLIYTNSDIKPAIEKSQLFAADSMRVVTGAREGATAPAVYDYFLVAPAPAAENILYLDTEVLIKKDIKPIFDILSEAGKEFLYVGGGGDKIMLFYNCPQTVELFDKLKETPELPAGSLNAEELQRYITPEIDCDFTNNKIFLTTTSQKEALSQLIEKSIAQNIEYTKYYIDTTLMPIIREIDEPLEGNIFFFHECITKYCDDFLSKCKNISYIVMNRLVCKYAAEIGYNAGFSSLLMMVSNPDLKISCFDIAYHRYTIPCYKRICEDYPGRVFLTVGDSKQTFTHFVNTSIADGGINKYNLIHVDGCHLEEEVISDIKYSMALAARAKYGSHIIIDDYDSPCIHATWDSYLTNEKYNIEDSKFYLEKNEYQDIKFIRGGDLPDGFN